MFESRYGFAAYRRKRDERLVMEFKATCSHEAGHLVRAFELNKDAINGALIKPPTILGVIDGSAWIDTKKLPEGRVAQVSFAGSMAEAKANCEDTWSSCKFNQETWQNVLNWLDGIYGSVDEKDRNRLHKMIFWFITSDGERVSTGGITSADLLEIPPDELNDDKGLMSSFAEVARAFDQNRDWSRVRETAKLLEGEPGREFTKDELLNFIAQF
jgi:hypothetical protein